MADTSIVIRASTLEDLDELERLMKSLTGMFHQMFFKDQWRMDMKYKYDVGGIFVAEDTTTSENKIVGMVLVDVGRDLRSGKMVGKIINFIVEPEQRGKGIGSRLLEKALDFSAERKAISVKINARRELGNIVQLFKKFGFEEVYMVMEREI
ncbi:MAG: GNAT family N-acetyltransferase [Candidatus Helarchaeota archaeon]|nr:GNAT family N-acetyltransferase [Candidatus Helarchaeota archaeon]